MEPDSTTTTTAATKRPHDRPARAPFGPRIRTTTKQSIDMTLSPTTSYADAAIQVPLRTFTAPPPLAPPPAITFESTPIQWKGLPLEVAQWTFSSCELQEIVSKAIRLSARESFVRLLSLQALEVDIVQEAQRLDTARTAAQAKYRFEVGRRTMLIQALNSSTAHPNEDHLIATFISQLSASVASCDALLASILQYSDQQSQIALIQHQHRASALGVALRKLNKAHERQSQDLRRAQERIKTLEDELEEAWREAEKVAVEFDELEQDVALSEGGSDPPPDPVVIHDFDETATLGDLTMNTDVGVVLGVTAIAVASKATLMNSPGSPRPIDKSDSKSIRSIKSTRSRRSIRDGPSHISRVTAARTRSRTASNASLRLPKSLRRSTSTTDPPPIPTLPPSTVQGQSFLDMHEHGRKGVPPPRRPEPSVALPTPPHSAGLPPTRVPSIWLETDGGKSTRLNGLDRTHSLQIFSSLTGRTPKKTRRSNLVMSLSGSDPCEDDSPASPVEGDRGGMSIRTRTRTGSSTGSGSCSGGGDKGSPVSLPPQARAHFHFRGPSASSSNASMGVGVGAGAGAGVCAGRPGSAGARLTTTGDTRTPVPVATPRRSLVSRASSVILRRLSQATIGSSKGSPTKSREALNLRLSGSGPLVERQGEGEEEGEVIVIGSPHPESVEGP